MRAPQDFNDYFNQPEPKKRSLGFIKVLVFLFALALITVFVLKN